MKRIVCFLAAVVMLVTLCACGVSAPANTVNSPADLGGKNIGVIFGSASSAYLGAYARDGAQITEYSNGKLMMDDLKRGILDCIIAEKISAKEYLPRTLGVKKLDAPLIRTEYAIAVAKENPSLTKDLNKALNEMREDGTLSDIISAYLLGSDYVYEPASDEEASNGILTLAVDAAFPPYEYYDGDGNVVGLDIDIAQALCDKLGVTLTVCVTDTADLLAAVERGDVSFAMGRIVPNEKDFTKVDFTSTYIAIDQQITVRKK